MYESAENALTDAQPYHSLHRNVNDYGRVHFAPSTTSAWSEERIVVCLWRLSRVHRMQSNIGLASNDASNL
jgi:hypothetical protein